MQLIPPSGEATETELVAALQSGKPEALSLLYDKYAPVVLGLITRIVQKSEMAEEVLQKTFAAIWLQRASYDATKLRLLSWIILIARDLAKAALPVPGTNIFSITTENSSFTPPNTQIITGEAGEQRLQDFCCNLNQTEKEALRLVYLQGLRCEEAAARLNLPVEIFKATLHRAVKHLGAERAA